MKCATCRLEKIGPEIHPFGGFFCCNGHLQCNDCTSSTKGYCGICKAVTQFVLMNFFAKEPLEQSHAQSPVQPSFSKNICEETEAQSKISSGEYLSIQSYMQNTNESDKIIRVNNLTKDKTLDENNKEMKTVFIGFAAAQKNIDNADSLREEENEKSTNHPSSHREFEYEEKSKDCDRVSLSDIRFLDSTESVRNIYLKIKSEELIAGCNNDDQRQDRLTVNVLHDFEIENPADNKKDIKKYLKSYSATTYSDSPVYSSHRKHAILESAMKTISVSTESDPSLKSTSTEAPELLLDDKHKLHDYLIMQADNVIPQIPSAGLIIEKNTKPSVDQRMQKILETFKEESNVIKFDEQPNLKKFPIVLISKPLQQLDTNEQTEKQSFITQDKNSTIIAKLINVYRAFYNPPNPAIEPVNNLHLIPQPQPVQQEPPMPQFQTVPCSSALAKEQLQNHTKFINCKPVPASILNIPRTPIECPISSCKRLIFVSDFSKHLVVDHNHMPIERINPFQCKNFFLDVRLARCGSSKCHLLYLMRDKITDLGSSEYKDFLPILVMTSRISLDQMCGQTDRTSDLEFFLIWVTGIAPQEYPISVSLTVWSQTGDIPSCHIVYSGQMYSIRKSQQALEVWQSGQMVLLSHQEIKNLTNNGKDMLNLQLIVH